MKTPRQKISFSSTVYMLKDWLILRVPEAESVKLSSRGQVSVTGTINGHTLNTVLEPDGYWSHWIHIDDTMQNTAHAKAGDTVEVELTQTNSWPEPTVPQDIAKALKTAPEKVKEKWHAITPMARWEWVRWVNATASDETRAVRIEKTISKLNGKHRRPCCFNLAACTEPYVAKNGRLIEPEKASA